MTLFIITHLLAAWAGAAIAVVALALVSADERAR